MKTEGKRRSKNFIDLTAPGATEAYNKAYEKKETQAKARWLHEIQNSPNYNLKRERRVKRQEHKAFMNDILGRKMSPAQLRRWEKGQKNRAKKKGLGDSVTGVFWKGR